MNLTPGLHERLRHLCSVVGREAEYLRQTDQRLFGAGFSPADAASLPKDPDLSERVDAFVARFGRLQDTLGATLLPRLLEALLEPQGSVLDNLNRAETLGWVRSAADWAALRLLRNRMVHEYVDDPELLAEALNAAHQGVPDLLNAALAMADKVAGSIGP